MANTSASISECTARFMELFKGSEQTHGAMVQTNGEFDHRTVAGAATIEDYEAHLMGTRGLGLVPVRKDGTSIFAAIDIDIDTINHQALYEEVRLCKMPLVVCRSRSGAAHLYVFMKEPGLKASRVIATLKRWAGILGFSRAEIFPKQTVVSDDNRGNWINLPYAGGHDTTRYAVGADGALSLEEFLNSVEFWDGDDTVTGRSPLNVLNEMPPCLLHILNNGGFAKGQRDQSLLNVAIFYKRAHKNGWEDQVRQFNEEHMRPPLPAAEVEKVIRSVGSKSYNYTCDQAPINEFCKRSACLKLEFGIAWNAEKPELRVSHLRKLMTDPPHYTVEVNGNDINLEPKEFAEYPKFRLRVEQKFNIVLPPLKPDAWDNERRRLYETVEMIEAAGETSEEEAVMLDIMDFLSNYKASTSEDDILRGQVILWKDQFLAFKVQDLQKFLQASRRRFLTNDKLYAILQRHGATYPRTPGGKGSPFKIKGKSVRVWLFPLDKANVQTEDYTPIDLGPKIDVDKVL